MSAVFAPLSPEEITAIWLSLRVALVAVAASLPFAIAVALLLSRPKFRGKLLLDTLVHLPLVLPPVVTGFALLLLLGRKGPLGAFLEQYLGIVIAFRWTGAALAAAIMAFPLMVRAIRLSIEAIDPELHDAAAVDGASRLSIFRWITLPLAMPGIVAGATLAFAKALGEFGATITFVSNIPGETQTIPSAIYSALQVPGGEGPALRLAAVSIAISVLALVASEWLMRRGRRT
jgi:molybdate transport system permease protein